MSFSVLVIPEDPTNDHYMLRPIVGALMRSAGKPRAKVQILTDPAAQGVEHMLSQEFLGLVAKRYPMVDLFIICVDRDGKPGREESLAHFTGVMQEQAREGARVLSSAAHQEIEVWCLAAMLDLPRDWGWSDVRTHEHPKETYYEPYARQRGLLDGPGDGREIIGREAAQRYRSIASRCNEVAALEEAVANV